MDKLPPLLSRLAPEMQLLACCARMSMPDRLQSHVDNLSATVNWDSVASLALHHGIVGLLHRQLVECDFPRVPVEALHGIAREQKRLRADAIVRTTQSMEVCRALQSTAVDAIHLKGLALDHQLFGGVSLRPAGDMDLLIRKRDVGILRDELFSLGYEAEIQGNRFVESVLMERWKDYCFRHPKLQHRVEVHWTLLNKELTDELTLEFFDEERRTIVVEGMQISTLGLNDNWLALSLHGAKHGFECLKWLADLVELSRANEMDLNRIYTRSKQVGLGRMVALTATLLRDLMGVTLDGWDAVDAPPLDGRLISTVIKYLNCPDFSQPTKVTPAFEVGLIDERLRQLRYAFVACTALNPLDVNVIRLPRWLWPMYYAVRFGRLVGKRIHRFRRGAT